VPVGVSQRGAVSLPAAVGVAGPQNCGPAFCGDDSGRKG